MVGGPGKLRVGRDRSALARHPDLLVFNAAVHISAPAVFLEEGLEICKQTRHWTRERIISPIQWRCPGSDTSSSICPDSLASESGAG